MYTVILHCHLLLHGFSVYPKAHEDGASPDDGMARAAGTAAHFAAVFVAAAASLGFVSRMVVLDRHCVAEVRANPRDRSGSGAQRARG